jgi:hypothetical protein
MCSSPFKETEMIVFLIAAVPILIALFAVWNEARFQKLREENAQLRYECGRFQERAESTEGALFLTMAQNAKPASSREAVQHLRMA